MKDNLIIHLETIITLIIVAVVFIAVIGIFVLGIYCAYKDIFTYYTKH